VALEEKQDWVGAVVDYTAIDRYKSVFENGDAQGAILSLLLPIYDVPFKDGTRKEYPAINWRQNIVSQDGIKSLFKNETKDAKAQTKINNTLCFSKEIVDSGHVYFKDEQVPQRYRTLFVGHGVPDDHGPMFKNGDEY
jgi:hypothetical protein